MDEDPDVAFERAALLFDYTEVGWDMTRVLWNGGVDVFNAGVIPVWNTATYYLVEPAVVLALEVFSLIFLRQHWEGVVTEEDFPYHGLDCTASAESAAWCGRYSFYKAELEAPERAPPSTLDATDHDADRDEHEQAPGDAGDEVKVRLAAAVFVRGAARVSAVTVVEGVLGDDPVAPALPGLAPSDRAATRK